jgi:hypothetical protein
LRGETTACATTESSRRSRQERKHMTQPSIHSLGLQSGMLFAIDDPRLLVERTVPPGIKLPVEFLNTSYDRGIVGSA